MANPAGIETLPNEILHSILSSFSTRRVLNLTPISRRFHDIILRILQYRLLQAASSKDHKLILECYHPSAKFYTPYLFCDYLDTPGLSLDNEQFGCEGNCDSLGKLSKLYSYFCPIKPDFDRRVVFPHPAGGWPTLPPMGLVNKHENLVCQDIHLESHELFSQLVTTTNLVKMGPKPGVFMSSVPVGEGLTRVWRDWLRERSTRGNRNHTIVGKEKETSLLWSDSHNNVGLGMNVEEIPSPVEPVFLRPGEDPAVSYTLQYKEVAIRTSQLLLKLEDALCQEVNHSGKATVIGSWVS